MSELRVSHLQVWDSRTGQALIPDLSFSVDPGSCLAIVGESGSGKSLACRSILRLHKPGVRQSGDIWLDETNLAKLSESEMRKMRGKRVCLIVQNGMRAFDPTRPVGEHFRETLAWHFGWGRDETAARMRRALESVLLKDPNAVMNGYPHELSGGMLQRAM
uniref:ATP-binding cassette domain-containing protein n=1 Tax=Cohnella sp. GbtcB17 TaxID=2824762 RepID=UPI001C30279E